MEIWLYEAPKYVWKHFCLKLHDQRNYLTIFSMSYGVLKICLTIKKLYKTIIRWLNMKTMLTSGCTYLQTCKKIKQYQLHTYF